MGAVHDRLDAEAGEGASTIRAIGSTRAVGLVTWSTSASRVTPRRARPAIAATTSSSDATGNGMGATTTRAPARPATHSG
ncbi:MAG: hypothetical protein FJ087_10485, partial [Deltaproteobacteria bacterium]|nr:hypothetical protein [Deltaproteobacteria bacterium]